MENKLTFDKRSVLEWSESRIRNEASLTTVKEIIGILKNLKDEPIDKIIWYLTQIYGVE